MILEKDSTPLVSLQVVISKGKDGLSAKEILISRLIDRPIRPLFPKNFYNEVQLFVTLFSADKEQLADAHAITAASASLMASNIPFEGPVAGVRVGRVIQELVLFPSKAEQEKSDMNIVLAGTEKSGYHDRGLCLWNWGRYPTSSHRIWA